MEPTMTVTTTYQLRSSTITLGQLRKWVNEYLADVSDDCLVGVEAGVQMRLHVSETEVAP